MSTILDYHSMLILSNVHILSIVPFIVCFWTRLTFLRDFFISIACASSTSYKCIWVSHNSFFLLFKVGFSILPPLLSIWISIDFVWVFASSAIITSSLVSTMNNWLNILLLFNCRKIILILELLLLVQSFHSHQLVVVSIYNLIFHFESHHHWHLPLGFCSKHMHLYAWNLDGAQF